MNDEPLHPVKTTKKSIAILEGLRDNGPTRISELAEEVDLGLSLVHNHLSTLQSLGYVNQNGDKYELTLRLLEFGGKLRNQHPLFQAAEQEIQDLALQTDELCNLCTQERGRLIYLFRARGDKSVPVDTYPGMHIPMNTSAAGKAILASLPQERVEEIVEIHGLPDSTDQSITDKETLNAELETIREQGYAFDDEERAKGIRCVAAPILNAEERPIGAISITGPKNRLSEERFTEELPDKITAVSNIIELNVKFGK
jgi:DNA-binding IclR family transcriptional regulator